MIEVAVKSGLGEFQNFLTEKKIKHKIIVKEAVDIGISIQLIGIAIGLANIIIELKKWLLEKRKDEAIVIIVNNELININSTSETDIRKKLSNY